MIPVSNRYALPLSLMMLLPIAIATFQLKFRSPVDDCVLPSALFDTEGIGGTQADPEQIGKHTSLRFQWSEGLVPVDSPDVEALEFRIVRSHNPKALFRSPLTYVREEIRVRRSGVEVVSVGDHELPIHQVYGNNETEITLGLYLFVYGSEPVASPYRAQLQGVLSDLISGGRPLTLFTISGSVKGTFFELADEAAKAWLVRAWERYDAICSP